MQRMLFAVAALAFVVGRYTAPAVEAKPVVQREVRTVTVEAPTVHCPEVVPVEPEDDPDAIDVENTEAMRLVEQESQRIARIDKGVIEGQVRDTATGESLAGVTVVAYTSGHGSQTAITDENGWYRITDLLPASYLVTLYYIDHAVEYPSVAVSAQSVTPLHARIDMSPPPPLPGEELGISFSSGTSIDNTYIVEQ